MDRSSSIDGYSIVPRFNIQGSSNETAASWDTPIVKAYQDTHSQQTMTNLRYPYCNGASWEFDPSSLEYASNEIQNETVGSIEEAEDSNVEEMVPKPVL